MFLHIFVNRLKCLIRDRQLVFWTFLYPLVIATLFSLAFSNLSSADAFHSIPIAVVDNVEYKNETTFQSVLSSVSDTNETSQNKLFHVTVISLEKAEDSLKNNKIQGYILFDNGAHVVVKNSGINQTILKQFMDSYLQAGSTYTTIAASNPQAHSGMQNGYAGSYLTDVSPAKSASGNTVIYFYALMAMASMFGGFWGNKEVSDIQANLSPQGARINLAPVHKMKAFGYSLCAAILIQFISLLILVAYLTLGLKVDFGSQLGYVLLTCLVGSIMGVSFGAFIGSIIKSNENLKIAVMIGVSMIFSALSGLMNIDIKYAATQAVPILAYINPANLLADSFYSLYYYTSHARYFLNIALLLGISVIFSLTVYFVTRRQKYASL